MNKEQRERAAALVANFKRIADTAQPGAALSQLRGKAAPVLEELAAAKATGSHAASLLEGGAELLAELEALVAAPQAPAEPSPSSAPASSSPAPQDAPQAPAEPSPSSAPASSSPAPQDAPQAPAEPSPSSAPASSSPAPQDAPQAPAEPSPSSAPAVPAEVLDRSGAVIATVTPPAAELAVSPAPPVRALEAPAVAPPPGVLEARDVAGRDRVREVRPETHEPDSSRRAGVIVAVPAAAWDPRVTGVIYASSPGSRMDASGARLAQVQALPAAVVAEPQQLRDPLNFADDPRPTIAIEAGATAPRSTGAVPALEATPAGASSPSSSSPAPSSAEPAPGLDPAIAKARASLDQINGSAANLQRAALELEEGPQRAALLEQAGRLRSQAAAIYAALT